MDEILENTNGIKYKTIAYLVNKLISGQIFDIQGYEKDNDLDIQVYLFYIMAISILLNNYDFFDDKLDELKWDNLRLFKTLKLNDIDIGDYKLESPKDKAIVKLNLDKFERIFKIPKKYITKTKINKEKSLDKDGLNRFVSSIIKEGNQYIINNSIYEKIKKYRKLPGSIINTLFDDDNMAIVKYFRNSAAHITSYISNDNIICIPDGIADNEELKIEYSIDQIAEILKHYLINLKPLARKSPEALAKYQQFIVMVVMMNTILDRCIRNGKNDERFERAKDIIGEIHIKNKKYTNNVNYEDTITKAYMDSLLNIMFVQNDYKEFEETDFDLSNVQVEYSRPKEENYLINQISSSYEKFQQLHENIANIDASYNNEEIQENKYQKIMNGTKKQLERTANTINNFIEQYENIGNIKGHKVIKAIRNALSHGSQSYEIRDGEYWVKINDRYDKKDSTFKCEVPFYDLIGSLLNNNVINRKYGRPVVVEPNEVSIISK